MDFLTPFIENVAAFFSSNPAAFAIQLSLVSAASVLIFMVAYATRDIILRTNSLLAQAACILMVAALPVVGFFLYMLVRPARTISERRLEQKVTELLVRMSQIRKNEQQKPQQFMRHQKHRQMQQRKVPQPLVATMPVEAPPTPTQLN